MTETAKIAHPLKVLLIGSGRRIQNNFLPALHCLESDFSVLGIHSRTIENLRPVAERWSLPAIQRLDDVDFAAVDVVAVSVPTASNAMILQDLHRRLPGDQARRVKVIIDTPVAWTRSEFRAVVKQIAGFEQLAIAEDYMNYPPFALMRRAIADSIIGRPKTLILTNTGYLYHGLALIRSLIDFRPVLASSRVPLGALGTNVRYRFQGGFEAHVIGPYRSHTTGGLVLEGDRGIITEFAVDYQKDKSKKNKYVLSFRREDQILSECVLRSNNNEIVERMPSIALMMGLPFDDKSDLNLLRGCGLMTVFRSLLDPTNINNSYGVENALYDSFVSQRATNGKFPLDPFVLAGTNAISLAARLLSGKQK